MTVGKTSVVAYVYFAGGLSWFECCVGFQSISRGCSAVVAWRLKGGIGESLDFVGVLGWFQRGLLSQSILRACVVAWRYVKAGIVESLDFVGGLSCCLEDRVHMLAFGSDFDCHRGR